MTKNVSHISQRTICPKCGTRNLRKSMSANNTGKEYFCDKDRTYFGIAELVNVWGYDAGDFYGSNGQAQLSPEEWGLAIFWMKKSLSVRLGRAYGMKMDDAYAPDTYEGEWSSEIARDESYDVVNRMLMEVEELEWEFDARDLPFPIGAVGSC